MPQIDEISSSILSPTFVESEDEDISSSSSSYILERIPDVDCPYSSDELEDFPEEELNVSSSVSEWLKEITDHQTNIVQILQEKYQHLLPPCTVTSELSDSGDEREVLRVIGERDAQGQLDGEVEIFYGNGDYFWGWYSHGVRQGHASLVEKSGDHYLGRYSDGQLDGFVTETVDFSDFHNITREVFYKKGVRHGYYREFRHNNNFWSLGKFINGKKSGIHWTRVEGKAFLVGELDEENRPDGESLYLYPDLITPILGEYKHGKLTQGRLVRLESSRRDCGILRVETVRSEDTSVIVYDQSSRVCISKTPHLRDFYEIRQVFVKESSIPFAGEGLWAKTDIKSGSLCALFNGVRQRHIAGVVQDQSQAWSDYRIGCSKELDLDILPHQVSLDTYSATLGHKACHSFTYNAHFESLWHPRFGKIMAVVANSDIKAGQEIQANYNYSLSRAPQWYRDQWFTHLREELNWPEKKIFSWVKKEVKNSGIWLDLPPPKPDSERYVGCGVCGDHVVIWEEESCCGGEVWYHRACLPPGHEPNSHTINSDCELVVNNKA